MQYKSNRNTYRHPGSGAAAEKRITNRSEYLIEYDVKLNSEQIENLIRLLEFAENDISRAFKRLNASDTELKDIMWYYKIKSRDIRLKLRAIRGW